MFDQRIPTTHRSRRHRATRFALAAGLSLGLGTGLTQSAEAKIQRVDVYSAFLDINVGLQAKLEEGGWSQVVTETSMSGHVLARADGLAFVDGRPQQVETPFTDHNVELLWEHQEARYTSPSGSDTGTCDQTLRDGKAEGDLGLISTSVGANAEDGSPRLSIATKSPSKVWIHKSCTGYLQYEVADPLIDEGVFSHAYIPMGSIGQKVIKIPFEGKLGCPGFIRIQNCTGTYAGGTLRLELQASYDRGQPDPVKPEPVVVPPKNGSPAEMDRFMLQIMIRKAHEENRYGQAVVRCGKPCEGKVSAYAIALSKQGQPKGPSTKVGSTTFKSDAQGNAQPSVPLTKGGRKLADRRGGIEYRVEASPIGGGNVATSIARAKLGKR